MNKKLQEMGDSAHEIPKGAYVPEGTVLVQLDPMGPFGEAELVHYVTHDSEYWQGSPQDGPVRSVDPLPDMNDTGAVTVYPSTGDTVHFDTDDGGCYDLTRDQARNLARKITEATDGD